MCVCVRWCRLRGCNSKRIPFSSASLLLMSAADDGTRVSPATREQREREKHSFIPSCLLSLYLSRCLRLPSLMTLSLHSLPRFPRATRRTSSSRERTSSQRVSLADTHSLLPASTDSHTHNRTHTLSLSHRKVCVRSVDRKSVLRDGSRGARAAGLRDASRATAHHGSE